MKVGLINGSPLNGLCYRVCIEAKQIFDGCKTQYRNLSLTLNLTNLNGAVNPPLTFVSVENSGSAQVSNLSITPTPTTDNDTRYIIDYDYTLPLLIRFTDSTGLPGTATSTVSLHNTVRLRIPSQSLTPYTIEVFAALFGKIGTFNGTDSVTVQVCHIVITKVTMIVDLLVPSYGYCEYPDCSTDSQICPGVNFDNLFPPL